MTVGMKMDEREELSIRLLEAIGTLRLQLEKTEEAENLQQSRQQIKQTTMKAIEIIIPEGYRLSPESTNERIVLELVEKSVEDEAKEFLFAIFNKMQVRVKPDNIGYVYYDIEGITVFEQDFKTNTLWVSYTRIWNVFESVFSMNYSEIQLFIKNMIEETLHWNGLIPVRLQFIP